jgi:hypothetical protein
MPRPEKFSEAVRRQRQRERLHELYPEYVSPEYVLPTDAPAAEDQRRAEAARAEFDKRTARQTKALSAKAAKLIPVLGLPSSRQQELVTELAALLAEVHWEWRSRRKLVLDTSLPVLGDVQPTHGEMRATIKVGLQHALALRGWYRSLPAGLLLDQTVSMTAEPVPGDNPPGLGVVINRLAETFAAKADQHRPRVGRPPGERAAAQSAACWLAWFMNRHAPDAPIEEHREFMFRCLRELGIPCPNLSDDPGDFNKWFSEVEALARPATAQTPEPRESDDTDAIYDRIKDVPL